MEFALNICSSNDIKAFVSFDLGLELCVWVKAHFEVLQILLSQVQFF
jgi:hypothetical protein